VTFEAHQTRLQLSTVGGLKWMAVVVARRLSTVPDRRLGQID